MNMVHGVDDLNKKIDAHTKAKNIFLKLTLVFENSENISINEREKSTKEHRKWWF